MIIDWSLFLNAVTGLGGAAVGGYFTLRAADRSFKLEREANAADLIEQKREALNIDLWRMTHRFRQICGAIEGANSGLAMQIARLENPEDPSLWRVMLPTAMSSEPSDFSADELLSLVRVNKAGKINSLLTLQELSKEVAARLKTYGRVREEVTSLHGREVLAGLTDEELFELDPRFGGVAIMAIEIKKAIRATYSTMKPVEADFWRDLAHFHREIGFDAVIKPQRVDEGGARGG